VIQSFKHKGLERFFAKQDTRGIPAQHAARIRRILDLLDHAREPAAMNLPGLKFHGLSGARQGEYSVSVSGNWRITFGFNHPDAIAVNLEDYH
jgi:proteic killer suppression protein